MTIEPVALAGHREVVVRDDDGKVSRHFVIMCFASRWIARRDRGSTTNSTSRAGSVRRNSASSRPPTGSPRSSPRRSSAWKRRPEPRLAPAACDGAICRDAYLTEFDDQTRLRHYRRRSRLLAGAPSARPRSIEGGPAPFDGDLQRLAEILGALHYLRGICGANDGQKWRNEMQALLDAEAPSGERRNRLQARLQPRLSRLPADLPDLHAGRRPGDPPLSRRRRQDLARDHRALLELTRRLSALTAPVNLS